MFLILKAENFNGSFQGALKMVKNASVKALWHIPRHFKTILSLVDYSKYLKSFSPPLQLLEPEVDEDEISIITDRHANPIEEVRVVSYTIMIKKAFLILSEFYLTAYYVFLLKE